MSILMHAGTSFRRGGQSPSAQSTRRGDEVTTVNCRMATITATIYIIEVDEQIRKFYAQALRDVDANVQFYASPDELLAAYRPNQPGCLLLDLQLHGPSGCDLLERAKAMGGVHPFIVIAAEGNIPAAVDAMRRGAWDYLAQPVAVSRLVDSVRKCLKCDADIRSQRIRFEEVERRKLTLTPRERRVMELLLEGKRSRQIAGELGISTKTVDVHRSHIIKKMHVDSVIRLIRLFK